MRLSIIGTGGTIASRETDAGVVAQADAAELLSSVTHLLPADLSVSTTDVGVRASFALRVEDMRAIAEAAMAAVDEGADGVVVLHGTDSMEETSFLADLMYGGGAPIVFTGAQRPFDDPDGDAVANIVHAVETASDPRARHRGALIAFHGRTWAATGARKVHTLDLAAFADPDGGPVDLARPADRARATISGAATAVHLAELPRVDVVALVPGGDGSAIREAAQHGARAIVLQALGIGNASPDDTAAAARLVGRGIPVVVTSRVLAGPVRPVYGNGGGSDLERHGAIFADTLSPWQARLLTTVALVTTPESATDCMQQWLDSETAPKEKT